MIRTLAASISLLALSVAGGFGLSQAHSSVMSFGPAAGDVTVATYDDLAPEQTVKPTALATPQTETAVVASLAPRLVVQSPKVVEPTVDVASLTSEPVVLEGANGATTLSLRPMARTETVSVPVVTLLDAAEPAPHVMTKRVVPTRQRVAVKKSPRPVQRYAATSSHQEWRPATTASRVVPNFLSGVYR
jgi:hypothetical protein